MSFIQPVSAPGWGTFSSPKNASKGIHAEADGSFEFSLEELGEILTPPGLRIVISSALEYVFAFCDDNSNNATRVYDATKNITIWKYKFKPEEWDIFLSRGTYRVFWHRHGKRLACDFLHVEYSPIFPEVSE